MTRPALRARRASARAVSTPAASVIALLLAPLLGAAIPVSVAAAQPLFRSDTVLELTLTTNLRDLVRERDSTKLDWFDADFRYPSGDTTVGVPVELRARGHFRRQRSNCDFPPIYLKVKKDTAQGTELQGNPRVKLTTPCKAGNDDFQQYILLEYGVYRMYEELLPMHPRTRLARISWRDSTERMKPLTVYAFFSEQDEEVAKEYDITLRENMVGARFADVHQPTLQGIALFSLMVGNSDWSLGGLHNIYLLQDSIGTIKPVAYDWDWVGLVNARYARPDYRLPIKSVAERYYMGPCYTWAEWEPAITHFKARRPAIDSLWASIPMLTDKKREQAVKYLDEFWKLLDDKGDFERLTKSCRREGN